MIKRKDSLLMRDREKQLDKRILLTRWKVKFPLSCANVKRAQMNSRPVAFSRTAKGRREAVKIPELRQLAREFCFGMRKEIRSGSLVCPACLHKSAVREGS